MLGEQLGYKQNGNWTTWYIADPPNYGDQVSLSLAPKGLLGLQNKSRAVKLIFALCVGLRIADNALDAGSSPSGFDY